MIEAILSLLLSRLGMLDIRIFQATDKSMCLGRFTALRAGLRQQGGEYFVRYPGLSHITARSARRYVTRLG